MRPAARAANRGIAIRQRWDLAARLLGSATTWAPGSPLGEVQVYQRGQARRRNNEILQKADSRTGLPAPRRESASQSLQEKIYGREKLEWIESRHHRHRLFRAVCTGTAERGSRQCR